MVKQTWALGLTVVFVGAMDAHAEPSKSSSSILSAEAFVIDMRDVDALTGHSIAETLEMIALPALHASETSGGFAEPDLLRVSLYGDAYRFTRWSIDGADVSDPFFAGTPALMPPSAWVETLTLRSREGTSPSSPGGIDVRVRTLSADDRGAKIRWWVPSVGGPIPGARDLMNALSGRHALERTPPPTPLRPTLTQGQMASLFGPCGKNSSCALEVRRGARRLVSFARGFGELAEPFDEAFTTVNAGWSWSPAVLEAPHSARSGTSTSTTPSTRSNTSTASSTSTTSNARPSPSVRLLVLSEYRRRNRLFSELFFAADETATFDSFALSLIFIRPRLRLAVTGKTALIAANDFDFTRELHDLDGEGFYPFYPSMRTFGANLDVTYDVSKTLYARSSTRLLSTVPRRHHWTNPVAFEGRPMGEIAWTSRGLFSVLGAHEVGVHDRLKSAWCDFRYRLYLSAMHAFNRSGANTLGTIDAGFSGTVAITRWPALRPYLTLNKTPIPYTPELLRVLDPDYQNGVYTNDGRTLDTTGGAYTTIARALRPTNIYALSIGLHLPLGRTFSVRTEGLFKLYRDTYALALADSANRFGTSSDDGAFFFSDGPTTYALGHRPSTPVYFGWHIELVAGSDPRDSANSEPPRNDDRRSDREPGRWRLSIAFSAYNVVGKAPFGNGAEANDISALSFFNATPNGARYALANLDTDRGFMLKTLVGYQVTRRFGLMAAIRFRDGQPFSFFEYHEAAGQVAVTAASPRGSPLKYTRPLLGPREDFQLTTNVALEYRIPTQDMDIVATLQGSNVFDLGNELQEVSGDAGQKGRAALLQQVPRSLIFGLAVQ